jgi:Transposase
VGRRCRDGTIKDVASELGLDWHTVKALEMQYMEAQLKRAGTPGPRAIGVDEIAIRKGHTYRIVVSDLDRGRPIWFGGKDRSEASMSQFYAWLGERKSSRIRLAVMDMWKPFAWRRRCMHRKPQFCSTSSMSCGISARLWMWCVERQVLPARQQGVFLALDVAPVAARKAAIFALAAQHRLCSQGEFWPIVEHHRFRGDSGTLRFFSLGVSRCPLVKSHQDILAF